MGKLKKSKSDMSIHDRIQYWFQRSELYDVRLDLKELSKLSKKKLIKEAKFKMSKDGRFIISARHKKYIDLSEYYDDPDRFYRELYFLIHSLDEIFKDESCRENYVSFIFSSKKDKDLHHMSTIHFVYNMIMWMPFFILNIPVSKNEVFMPLHFTNNSYINYINDKVIEPYKHLTTHNEMSNILAKMYDLFQRLSDLYGLKLGISFSMYDIINKWDNPELYSLNHTEIPQNYQISEMEEYLTKQTKRYVEIMTNEYDGPDDSLRAMMRAGQINIKQCREFLISIGTKPDLSGNTYPHMPGPGVNLTVRGLRDPADFVSDANGGRKSAILALNIDEGGYLARVFCKACSNIELHNDPNYDCGSENYYECKIHNKEQLSELRGRWYLNKKNNKLRQLIDTDYEMIGETLKFRSPTTCASENGKICATCYGHLAMQNFGMNIGINSALLLSESNYQLMMSAKHVLDTNTTHIEFNPEFDEYFCLEEGYRVMLREDSEELESYELWININCIHRDKDIDNLENNEYVKDFIIYDKDRKEKITIHDTSEAECEIYLASQLFIKINTMRANKEYNAKGYIRINMSEFETDKDLFFVRLKNDELTKPLRELKLLIEKGGDIGIPTVSELIDTLRHLMRCGGIRTESVHVEVLCRNLVRDRHNKINLPDWSKPEPEYIITSMHNSIFWSSSIINSLTFEKIKIQLKDPLTYKKRGTSFLDPCFVLDYNA